jgi:probable DNA repair protein
LIEEAIIDWDSLYAALAGGGTAITGNNRLAAAIRRDFERRAVDEGLEVWTTPDVIPWSAWVMRSWEEMLLSGAFSSTEQLLTNEQELLVWKEIISNSDQGHGLLRTEATAKIAREAARLLRAWMLGNEVCSVSGNEDAEAFHSWVTEFDRQCRASSWLTTDTLPATIARGLNRGEGPLPRSITLIGFDELTPMQQHLMHAMQAHTSVNWVRLSGETGDVLRLACDDEQDELKTLARWARSRLEANPDAHIGIIEPRLSEQRSKLAYALDEVLVPEAISPGKASTTRPWNISLGTPLGEHPIIQSAFLILELMRGRLSLEQAGRLLRSPHIAEARMEEGPRALLDVLLRQRGELEVSLKSLIYFAGLESRSEYCPLLLERLTALQAAKESGQGKASSVEWAGRFAVWLRAGGWAQGRSLSSEEYQAVEKWRELLASFSALEAVTSGLSFSEALSILRRLAADCIFQPQSDEAPIQVLGLYEAIGQRFDHLWIMGFHEEQWPPAPSPNPFLPLSLQRQEGMPRASQERELAVARKITQRLSESAPEVIVSYPKRQAAESLRPSPLIIAFSEIDKQELEPWNGQSWLERVRASHQQEAIERDAGPPLERKQAKGGSTLFRLQSLCPFRAFAELRLGARPLEQATLGLDARDRGTLLHKVMELFWKAVGSHQGLMQMQDQELHALIDDRIEVALDALAQQKPQIMTRNFRAVEKDRLRQLVLKWLEMERARAEFEVIGHEQAFDAEINGVGVHLLIDRIDRLADGRKIVIDYKTGAVKPSQWFGERPEEPQLPLYSTVIEDEVAAVLFGQLRAGDVRFNGVVSDQGLIEGLPGRNPDLKKAIEEWSQLQADWRSMLERLAHDFRQGVADVDPKQENTCTTSYCMLAPLCRIHEQRELNNQLVLEDDHV